jgi:Restriction endonuclease S subunits
MTSSWSERKLGDLIQINPDALNKTYPYSEIEYLDISSVGTGYYTETCHLKLEEAPSRAKRLVSDGDTIISTVRPGNKSYCYLKKTTPRMVVSTGFAVLRAKKDLLDERFLYYLVSNPAFTEYLVAHEKGAAYPAVGTETIENAIVNIPDLPTQKKISDILGSLDDKIELNRRMNETLEQMAMAQYKHWFVDFGPFQDGEFVESELGEIPSSWRVGRLGDIVSKINNSEKAGEHLENIPYVPIDELSSKSLMISGYKSGLEAKSSLIRFQRNDILFGAMRPYFHKVCIAPFDGITRSTCFVLRPRKNHYFSFSVLCLFSEQTVAFATVNSKGSTIPYAVWDGSLADMKICIPEDEVLKEFDMIVSPMLEQIIRNFYEIKALSETRDYLLPRLLSGEIEVREAEEQVEEVLAHA